MRYLNYHFFQNTMLVGNVGRCLGQSHSSNVTWSHIPGRRNTCVKSVGTGTRSPGRLRRIWWNIVVRNQTLSHTAVPSVGNSISHFGLLIDTWICTVRRKRIHVIYVGGVMYRHGRSRRIWCHTKVGHRCILVKYVGKLLVQFHL